MGFSIALPKDEHLHFCDNCADAWEHADADCVAPAAYSCPDHQPRSGYYYESWAGEEAEEQHDEDGDYLQFCADSE